MPNQEVRGIHDGHAADAVLAHEFREIANGCLGSDGNHVFRHHVLGAHWRLEPQ